MYCGISLRFGNKLPLYIYCEKFREIYVYEIVDVVNAILGMAS